MEYEKNYKMRWKLDAFIIQDGKVSVCQKLEAAICAGTGHGQAKLIGWGQLLIIWENNSSKVEKDCLQEL